LYVFEIFLSLLSCATIMGVFLSIFHLYGFYMSFSFRGVGHLVVLGILTSAYQREWKESSAHDLQTTEIFDAVVLSAMPVYVVRYFLPGSFFPFCAIRLSEGDPGFFLSLVSWKILIPPLYLGIVEIFCVVTPLFLSFFSDGVAIPCCSRLSLPSRHYRMNLFNSLIYSFVSVWVCFSFFFRIAREDPQSSLFLSLLSEDFLT